jgi:uncharacterized protein YggE
MMILRQEEKMKPLGVLATVLLLGGLAGAQEKSLAKAVRVTGTAEVQVVPDRAEIEIGVEKQDPSATVAKHAEDAAARRILATLRANGIDDKDVQTTFLSLQPRVNYRKESKTSYSYFVASQRLTVTVRDLAKLDTILESMIRVGGNRIDSIEYEVSDLRKYRDQARDLAVKAAREKARALAQALGQDIGRAQAIEEPSNGYGFTANTTYSYAAPGKVDGATTAAGQTTISASVTVSFDLI